MDRKCVLPDSITVPHCISRVVTWVPAGATSSVCPVCRKAGNLAHENGTGNLELSHKMSLWALLLTAVTFSEVRLGMNAIVLFVES